MGRILFILLLLLPVKGVCDVFPITVIKGFIISQATIEGEEVLVILDTGAPGLVLNQHYYDNGNLSGITCTGINGTFEVKSRQVNEWSWLGVSSRKTKALVSDLSFLEKSLNRKIHALVGLEVVKDFFVSLDFDQQLIIVTKEFEEGSQGSFSRFQYVDHLPVINCRVNGQKKTLGLDTGSAENYLFEYEGVSDQDLLASASPILVVGTGNKEDLKHRISCNVDMQENEIFLPSGFIVDLVDKSYVYPAGFDGLLGQSFLSNFNITLHPGKQKILLKPRSGSNVFASAVMP